MVENYPHFLKLCRENLAKDGAMLIASKAYYYGNGGSIAEFSSFFDQHGNGEFVVNRLFKLGIGMGNRREIISIEWANKNE